MMSSQLELTQELQKQIDREVEEILDQARGKADSLMDEAHRQRDERFETALDQLEVELNRRRSRALSRALREQRNAILSLRTEEVDRVFEVVRERLAQMGREQPERFKALLDRFFELGRARLGEGPIRVVVGEAPDGFVEHLLQLDSTQVVRESGWLGLVVQAADGRVRCDYSLDVLLEQCRVERQWDIEDRLFDSQPRT